MIPRAIVAGLALATGLTARAAPPIGATMPGVTMWAWDLGEPLERWPTVVEGQAPNAYANHDRIAFAESVATSDGELADMFAGLVWGWLRVDVPGTYRFHLRGDDGARLVLDGRIVLDTVWGEAFTVNGAARLDAGLHRLEIPFYEDRGRFFLELQWQPPGADALAPVPVDHLVTEAGQTFVTAPGRKQFFIGEDTRRPGDMRPLDGVHPAFDLQAIRPPGFEPPVGGMAFLPDGRLAVCTWEPAGRVYLLDGLDGPEPVTVSTFAEGLGEPLGLAVVGGEILVAQKREITRLRDLDGDGIADAYEVVAGGWPASHNYHEFTFNLVALDGFLYTCTSVPLKGGHTNYVPGSGSAYAVGPGPGSVLKVDPATGGWEIFATGLRTPNGLALGPDGELFCSDNQGSWLPCSRINRIRANGFYGHQAEPDGAREADPPVAWMPHGEIGNSPAQPALVPDGPYVGQLLVGDVTHGGIKRLFVERVGDVHQAALFRFSQGLEAGVNRLVWGPDGTLYVGGLGADGNWHHRHTRFGLERLVPSGRTAFEMHRIEARADGFTVTFTQPVPSDVLWDPARYAVMQYRYEPTIAYGGPKLDVERLAVTRVTGSSDRRQAHLVVPGRRAGHVVHLRLVDVVNDDGAAPWTTECWYTLNVIPERSGPAFDSPRRLAGRDLERAAPPEATVLFDGADVSALAMVDTASDVTWRLEHGTLVVDQVAGDVLSREPFGDCRLHAEWYSPPGGPLDSQRNGNSGVKLQSRYEIQIMNTGGPPREPRFNEAGAIYRIKAADENASTGPGTWQTYDVWFTAPRWDGDVKTANARMTVFWNGVLVHDDVEVPTKTGMSDDEAAGDHPLLLQAHASDAVGDVRFRNVWVLRDP